jgi:hypothetical protein
MGERWLLSPGISAEVRAAMFQGWLNDLPEAPQLTTETPGRPGNHFGAL